MNPKHIRYVLAVLEEGGITKAAKKLYISQPSLSQMIKQIETSLGTAIFNRGTDPISLTYTGEKYVSAGREILHITENLYREVGEILNEAHGVFHLGIPVQRGLEVLPFIISYFSKTYPHVELRIHEQGSSATEHLLLEGTLDMACLTTSPQHEELHYILLEKEELVLLAAGDTNLSKRIPSGTPISITDAREESFISTKEGHSTRIIQDNLFLSNHMTPDILLETASIEVGKKTALACQGVMLCPLNYLNLPAETHAACSIYPIKGIENDRHFYISYRKNLYLTKYMKDFIGILQKKYQSVTPETGTRPVSLS